MTTTGREFLATVPGTPIPQGSKSARVIYQNGKARAVLFDNNKNLKKWRKKMHETFQEKMNETCETEPLDGPLELIVNFYFPEIKSRKGEIRHQVKPDLDKLIRAVNDSLESAGVINNDSRICKIQAMKNYSDKLDEGLAVVKVMEIKE